MVFSLTVIFFAGGSGDRARHQRAQAQGSGRSRIPTIGTSTGDYLF